MGRIQICTYKEKKMKQLNEGGNIFKSPTGELLTQRIQRDDVPNTIKWLESATGLEFPI